MATSRTAWVLAYLESAKNLAGCSGGLCGLGLALTETAGAYWPVVVAGLYGVGALLAPPERPRQPAFHSARARLDAELAALREDFAALQTYLEPIEIPEDPQHELTELRELLAALLHADHGPPPELLTDPETLYALGRAVRQDIPETVDSYLRTRWWSRLATATGTPEDHLTRQLTALLRELLTLAHAIRTAHEDRQSALTRYFDERSRHP